MYPRYIKWSLAALESVREWTLQITPPQCARIAFVHDEFQIIGFRLGHHSGNECRGIAQRKEQIRLILWEQFHKTHQIADRLRVKCIVLNCFFGGTKKI